MKSKPKKKLVIRINEGTPKERVIGLLDYEKGVFVKEVYGSRHLFRKLDAWGIDAQFFEDVLLPNNFTIRVIDKERDIVYETTAIQMKQHGYYYHFKRFEDWRPQIFLPRKYWERLSKKDFEMREAVITLGL